MAATGALGPGIKIPDVGATLHVDSLLEGSNFLQEVGRSARKTGTTAANLVHLPPRRPLCQSAHSDPDVQ